MDAILREFPYEFETERLLIRGPLPGDGARLRTAVLESQPELEQWLPWAVSIPSEEDYEKLVRQGQAKFLTREDLWLLLFEKQKNALIGSSGLHRIDWQVPRFEIGYWLHTGWVGQGYMTEAVTGITDFAFRELDAERVEIRCDALNERSAAVARRVGFTHEGTLRAESRHHLTQALRDTMIFAKLRADFERAA